VNKDRSEAFSKRLKSAVDAALKRRGISARQASFEVVGHDGLIRDIRAGRMPSPDKLEALFEFLGMEFYFGAPRDRRVDLSFNVGGEDFIAVPRYDVRASAGPGTIANEEAPVGALAFRQDWLHSQRLSAAELFVIEVAGPSMEPDLTSGDLVLVDKTRRTVGTKGRDVYAFVDTDGSLRIKRLERLDTGLVLHSDNPDFHTEMRDEADAARIVIVGKVVWSGHSWAAK
jgi:SOS-response transcriptional repressor LexA